MHHPCPCQTSAHLFEAARARHVLTLVKLTLNFPQVLKFREEKGGGHFASSAQPRNPRPPHVEFRVGQVIKHKLWGYHGVIIGWDETAKYAVKTNS